MGLIRFPQRSPARSLRRAFILALLLTLVLAGLLYAAIVAYLFFNQQALIFAGIRNHQQPWAYVKPPPYSRLLFLNGARKERIAVLFGAALDSNGRLRRDGSRRPTVLFCYGNAACIAGSLDQFEYFRRLGDNVIIPDYAGYGLSSGTASEASCFDAAEAAYNYLTRQRHTVPGQIVVAGWSLGGASAIEVASRHRVGGLITFSAFTRLAPVAQGQFPWIPVTPLLHYHFDNLDRVPKVRCPILLVHGTQDTLVPFSMADQLAAAARSPVTRVTVRGAGHADIFMTGGAALQEAVHRFVNRCAQQS